MMMEQPDIIHEVELPDGWYWLPDDFRNDEYGYDYWAASSEFQVQVWRDIDKEKHIVNVHKFVELDDEGVALFDVTFDLDKRFHSTRDILARRERRDSLAVRR